MVAPGLFTLLALLGMLILPKTAEAVDCTRPVFVAPNGCGTTFCTSRRASVKSIVIPFHMLPVSFTVPLDACTTTSGQTFSVQQLPFALMDTDDSYDGAVRRVLEVQLPWINRETTVETTITATTTALLVYDAWYDVDVPDVDCVGSWGACNLGTALQTYSISTQQQGTGVACPSLQGDTRACIVNAKCGPADGDYLPIKPTLSAELCDPARKLASAPVVTGTGPWDWICIGLNGGTNATCSANKSMSMARCASRGGVLDAEGNCQGKLYRVLPIVAGWGNPAVYILYSAPVVWRDGAFQLDGDDYSAAYLTDPQPDTMVGFSSGGERFYGTRLESQNSAIGSWCGYVDLGVGRYVLKETDWQGSRCPLPTGTNAAFSSALASKGCVLATGRTYVRWVDSDDGGSGPLLDAFVCPPGANPSFNLTGESLGIIPGGGGG